MKFFVTGASGFIGTHVVETLVERGHTICNYDPLAPKLPTQRDHWIEGDILDAKALTQAMTDFQPEVVIHLAARTDCDENTTVEKGYQANTTGVANVLSAIKATPSIQRVVMTSTQYVSGPGRLPDHDRDYFPHTVYGQSKVDGEILTREANLPCTWCFIRPVNIWGPHHARYGKEFWKIAFKGLYLHPNLPAPTRAYGYIGNVIWQLCKILDADAEVIHEKAIYVGDNPIKIDRWSKGFVREFRGKDPLVIPFAFMKMIGLVGDGISKVIGRPFYLTSSRLKSMTQDYLAPVQDTHDLFGEPPYSLEEGIRETADWYREWQKTQ